MFRTPLSLFRTLSIAEAITWTLLIAALIVRGVGGPPIVLTIAGSIHGFVFLSYGATAILVSKNQRWGFGPMVTAIVSAVIPYATIPVEIWLHRTGRLVGEWRLEATDDPRDAAWHDRFLRVLLRRPWILAVLLIVAITVVFTVLLILGPPGGR